MSLHVWEKNGGREAEASPVSGCGSGCPSVRKSAVCRGQSGEPGSHCP